MNGRRSRLLAGVIAGLTVAAVCVGCASANQFGSAAGEAPTSTPGSTGPDAAGSDAAGSDAAGSAGPDTSVSAPAISAPPTGPAASAAIGTPPPQGKHAVAKIGDATVTCADPYAGVSSKDTLAPLPAEFKVAAVVRCETVARSYPGLGQWSVQLAEVAQSQDFSGVIAELRKPSAPLTSEPCAAYGVIGPWIALIDEAGHVVRPKFPSDECGRIDTSVGIAVQKLDFQAVDAVRIAQMRSPASLDSGCAQSWKDMVAFEASPGREPDGVEGSVAEPASPPSSVLVCLYSAGPADHGLRGGDLIKGVTVTTPAAGDLAADAEVVSELPSACADAGKFVTLIYDGGRVAYAEMGGCHRLLTDDGRIGAASQSLLDRLAKALG